MIDEAADRFMLSPDEMLEYRRDGFLIRERVFSEREVELLRGGAERAAARVVLLSERGKTYHLDGKRFVDAGHVTVQFEHGLESKLVRVIEPVHELDEAFDALVDDPRIVSPMRQLVGSKQIALWTDKLNLKRPREGSAFGWHQDSPYWVHDCDHVDQLPNVLVAFDDASVENGCFRVIRGSHTTGCLPGISDGSQLGGFYTDPDCFDEADQVAMEVPAGSMVFFDPHSIHGSFPNTSNLPRRAMVLTYQPAGFPMLKSGKFRNVGVSETSRVSRTSC